MSPSYTITRVNISLPCHVPVLPGTPTTDAPLEARTERCAVDAWWFVGTVPTCDVHLRVVLSLAGDSYERFLRDFLAQYPDYGGRIPNEDERRPWDRQRRYPQDDPGLPHPRGPPT